MADIREELQEIKASQSASAPMVDKRTPVLNLHWGNDDGYHGNTYSFKGGILHPIRGERGRGDGGEASQCSNMPEKKWEPRLQLVVN
jgi:hypothetical protein